MYDAGVKEPAESSFDPQPGGRKSAETHRSTLKPQSPAPSVISPTQPQLILPKWFKYMDLWGGGFSFKSLQKYKDFKIQKS